MIPNWDKKLKEEVGLWAEAEGCETGEVMENMLSTLSFPDYVPDWYLEKTAVALVQMMDELKADFKIEDGLLVDI